jgi:hypothetical protein
LNKETIINYNDFLNISGSVNVCGLQFLPSDILKELDLTAYENGLQDFVNHNNLLRKA